LSVVIPDRRRATERNSSTVYVTVHTPATGNASSTWMEFAKPSPLEHESPWAADALVVLALAEAETRSSNSPSLARALLEMAVLDASLGTSVAARVQTLVGVLKEEGEAICEASVANFVEFLSASRPSQTPAITTTPEGDVYAKWEREGGDFCSLRFFADRTVAYVARSDSHTPRRSSGRVSISEVVAILGRIASWVTRNVLPNTQDRLDLREDVGSAGASVAVRSKQALNFVQLTSEA
jgi:hypothetical protein